MNRFTYKTITGQTSGIYTEKGSKFIGVALPVTHEDEVKDQLKILKNTYKSARHYCYAYILGNDHSLYRANDDGEPSGTAGKPILGQINSLELTNVLVVVVRYFGGVLLGTGGLTQAYKAAARLALEEAVIIDKEVTFNLCLHIPYAEYALAMEKLKKIGGRITQELPGDTATRLTVEITEKNRAFTHEFPDTWLVKN